MHDDRVQVERRIDRMLAERLRPAVYGETAPLLLESWQAPGEPVPVSEGLERVSTRRPRPARRGGRPGAPPGSGSPARSPRSWAGHEVEAVVDLGFALDRPGFSAEALAMRPDGSPIKALNPLSTWLPVGAPVQGGEQVEIYVEAAANPDIHGSGVGTLPRGRADGRQRAALPRTTRRARRLRSARSGSWCRTWRCSTS